jgi:uncharacterized membrane protein YphA (DoxX/SURF4 family)
MIALRVLSLVMGGFLFLMATDKLGWFTDGGAFLTSRLYEWVEVARPAPRWYLEQIAIPYAPVLARLVPLGEFATGTALLLGFQVRLASILAMFMVLNFHFASDILFRFSYLINGYGPPVLGSLLALAINGSRLPFALDRRQQVA